MLTFENNRISGFGSFDHKDTLKFYRCKWDNDAKNWVVPPETDLKIITKLIKKINEVCKEAGEVSKDYINEAEFELTLATKNRAASLDVRRAAAKH